MKDMDYFRLLEGFANQLCNYIMEGLRCVGGACVAKFFILFSDGKHLAKWATGTYGQCLIMYVDL